MPTFRPIPTCQESAETSGSNLWHGALNQFESDRGCSYGGGHFVGTIWAHLGIARPPANVAKPRESADREPSRDFNRVQIPPAPQNGKPPRTARTSGPRGFPYSAIVPGGHILGTIYVNADNRAASIASATRSRSESNRSLYTSSVIAADLCPSIRCTAFT